MVQYFEDWGGEDKIKMSKYDFFYYYYYFFKRRKHIL